MVGASTGIAPASVRWRTQRMPGSARTGAGVAELLDIFAKLAPNPIEGNAPVEIATLFLNDVEVAPKWTTTTRWSLGVALRPGVNRLAFTGRDVRGATVGTAVLNVTSTANWTPPLVETLMPLQGSTRGGTEVELFGTNLQPGMRVWFGGAESLTVTVTSSMQARAVTPPGTGQVDVRAENPDGDAAVAAVKVRGPALALPSTRARCDS
jgi:hypothetical protein